MILAMAGAVLVLVLAAFLSLWKPEAGRRTATWIAPAVGFVAGSFLVRGWPPFPARDAVGWVFWTVLLVAVIGAVAPKTPRWSRWIGPAFALSGLLYLMLRPLIGRVWEGSAVFVWLGGIGLVWLAAWVAMAQSHRAAQGWRPLALLLLSTIGLSILLIVGGTASYAQYALAIAGVIAGAGLGSLPGARRLIPDSRPSAVGIVIPWMGLLVAAHFYADLPITVSVLATVSLLSLVFPWVPKLKNLSGAWLLAIQIGWTMLALVIAIVMTHQAQSSAYDF